MAERSDDAVKDARRREHLDSVHIRNPREETTKAEALRDFWFWNPPTVTEGRPDHWDEWKVFGLIDPEAGDAGIDKPSVDMARYFVERAETDRDFWDALRLILGKTLVQSSSIDHPYLGTWLIALSEGARTAPPQKSGNACSEVPCARWVYYILLCVHCLKTDR